MLFGSSGATAPKKFQFLVNFSETEDTKLVFATEKRSAMLFASWGLMLASLSLSLNDLFWYHVRVCSRKVCGQEENIPSSRII